MSLFNPETYDESTGLFPNDEKAKVVAAACVRYDYNGKQPTPAPCVKLSLIGEGMEKAVDQYWGVGKSEDWAPSPDGKKMIPVGKRQALHKSTNMAMLGMSLHGAGFPEELEAACDEDITNIVGLSAHWVRTKVKREGLKDAAGNDKEFEVLLVTQIYALPGEGDVPASSGGNVEAKATAAVLRYVAAAGKKGVKKNDLPMLVFQDAELENDPDKNAILTALLTDTVLAAGPWDYADGVVKAA